MSGTGERSAAEPKPGTPLHSLAVLMAQARIRIARDAEAQKRRAS